MPETIVTELDCGIYSDISHSYYHALPYVSNGYMGKLAECPAAAKVPVEDTPTLLFGRASHCLILEGQEVFDKEFAVAPQCDKRTKEGKLIFAAFQAEAGGKDVIGQDEFDSISHMREAVMKHPFASKLLSEGASETTIVWDDQITGLRCKCRPDRNPSHISKVLLDLKTTSDASAEGFQRSVINYGYARQAAFYLEGMARVLGEEWNREGIFAFIAVEKVAPFRVEVYTLDFEFMAYGRKMFRDLLTLELACRDENYWPHFKFAQATELNLPGYLQKQLSDGVVMS